MGDRDRGIPERELRVLHHHLGKEPAHAVADQDHPIERPVGFVRIEVVSGLCQCLAQPGGGAGDRLAGRVEEHPELIPRGELRGVSKFVDGLQPGPRTGDQAVDEYHGDLTWLVGAEHVEAGIHIRPARSRTRRARSTPVWQGLAGPSARPAASYGHKRAMISRWPATCDRSRNGSYRTSVAAPRVDWPLGPIAGDHDGGRADPHLAREELVSRVG